jgi:hypothetical protein
VGVFASGLSELGREGYEGREEGFKVSTMVWVDVER